MSFKSYINYINESVVDQYLAVRDQTDNAMKVVDDYQKTKKGGILHKLLPRFFSPAVKTSMPGQGVNASREAKPSKIVSFPSFLGMGGSHDPVTGSATSIIQPTNGDTQDTVGHELAHGYQTNAELKNTKVNRLSRVLRMTGKMLTRRDPYAKSQTRKEKIKSIGDNVNKAVVGGMMGGIASMPHAHHMIAGAAVGSLAGVAVPMAMRARNKTLTPEYWNSNIEVNSRLIGHAVRHLGGKLSDDNSGRRIGGYNNYLANDLRARPEISSSDMIPAHRGGHIRVFRLNAKNDRNTQKTLKKGMHQFHRILQHHEEQLPADIHTPEGREAFIRTHGSREGDEQ